MATHLPVMGGVTRMKERVVGRFDDPIAIIGRKRLGLRARTRTRAEDASAHAPAPTTTASVASEKGRA